MPLPLLAGIPWLATIIAGAFASIFSWFVQYLTKKLAMVGAAIVTIGALTVGIFTLFQGLITGLAVVMPDFVSGSALFLPGNATACLTAWCTAKVARWAYDWNVKIIQWELGL